MEESAAAADSLRQQAARLAQTVALFKVAGGERMARSPARQAVCGRECQVSERAAVHLDGSN